MDALAVTSISPSSGPTAGGTSVTIVGTGIKPEMVVVFFTSDETYAEFGEDLVVVSSTIITCKTPAGAPGTVWVGVGVLGDWEAQHAFLEDAFTFEEADEEAPELFALDYDLADSAGGDQITISGAYLADAISCEVGGSGTGESWTPATIASNTSGELTFTMPAKSAGMHSVRVSTAAGGSNTLAIEAWSPADEPGCTSFAEAPGYNATSGEWTTRVGPAIVSPPALAPAKVPALGGAPNFDGSSFLHTQQQTDELIADSGGTIAIVAAPSAETTGFGSGALSPYQKACLCSKGSSGPFGFCIEDANDVGRRLTWFGYDVVAGSYKEATRPNVKPLGSTLSLVGTYVQGVAMMFSVDGSDLASSTAALAEGGHLRYAYWDAYFIGANYDTSRQHRGPVRAFAAYATSKDDVFVTRWNKWSRVRHGAAA
ncbi:MAG: IPT/TIG domain-containing protein [Labilithrix sp.]|nr:IPT/TIG domain-containing protein [Labilithrix sp.]